MTTYLQRLNETLLLLIDLGLITEEAAEEKYAQEFAVYEKIEAERKEFFSEWKDPRPWWKRLLSSDFWPKMEAWERHVNRSDT